MDKFEAQALTYKEFFEMFNAVSQNYHAYRAYITGAGIGVAIVEPENVLIAVLYKDYRAWKFDKATFNSKELLLMAKLAATSPELREEVDNGRD